jgi:Rrf2 family protein
MSLKVSTKGRYGLRALIDLAMNSTGKPVLLADIARRQGLSKRYLERLFTQMRSAGIIRSVRGAAGGYVLNRPAEDIMISEVVESLEGPIRAVDCVSDPARCARSGQCVTFELWQRLGECIKEKLSGITLADLRKRQIEKNSETTEMYFI